MADKASSSSNPPPSPQGQKALPSSSGEPPSIVNPQPPLSAAASTVPVSSSTGQSRQQYRRSPKVQLPFPVGSIPDFTFNNIDFQAIINQDYSPSPPSPSPSWNRFTSSPPNPPSSPKRQASPPSGSGEPPFTVNPQPPSSSAAASTIPEFTFKIEYEEVDDQDSSPSSSPRSRHSSSSPSSPPSPKRQTSPPRTVKPQPPPSAAAGTVPISFSWLSLYPAVKEQILRSARRRPSLSVFDRTLEPNLTGKSTLEPTRPFQKTLRFFNGYLKPSLLPDLPTPADLNVLVHEIGTIHARIEELRRGIFSLRQQQRSVMERQAAKGKKQAFEDLLYKPPPNLDRYNAFVAEQEVLQARIEELRRELHWQMQLQGPLISNQLKASSDPSTSNQTNNDNVNQKVDGDAPGVN